MQGLRIPVATAIALAALLAVSAQPSSAKPRGRVLATGDSMIQYVDVELARRLKRRHFKVRSDAHVGTGLSKPFQLDWVRHSRHIVRRYRPRATVVFLGANEGFPLRRHGRRVNRCSRAWAPAYAGRAPAMMRPRERGALSRVYWLAPPAARERQ